MTMTRSQSERMTPRSVSYTHLEQVHADHNLEEIVYADKDRGNSTEEKHQGISDKESHNRGDGTRFSVLCKTCEVRGCGSAGNEEMCIRDRFRTV